MKKRHPAAETAFTNLSALIMNPYPGRGLIIGLDEIGENFLQVYWIMGRSPGSRNRILVDKGDGRLETELADHSKKPADTSLIIYCAMAEMQNAYAVSNGHQTEEVLRVSAFGFHMDALMQWDYEPDAPNFTPRITSSFIVRPGGRNIAEISIIKKAPFSEGNIRQIYRYEDFMPGLGFCVTTYLGDGNPLPSFTGEPYPLPLEGDPVLVAQRYWRDLDDENKVALAVKAINLKSKASSIYIINKFESIL